MTVQSKFIVIVPVLSSLQSPNDTLRLTSRLPEFRINRRSSGHNNYGSSHLGRLLRSAQMWVDPVRWRTRLRRRGRCERAKWGRRDERAVEACTEVVSLRWWRLWWLLLLLLLLLALVGCRVGLTYSLGIAHLDRCRESRRRWRGTPERMAIGGFPCICRDLRMLGIV